MQCKQSKEYLQRKNLPVKATIIESGQVAKETQPIFAGETMRSVYYSIHGKYNSYDLVPDINEDEEINSKMHQRLGVKFIVPQINGRKLGRVASRQWMGLTSSMSNCVASEICEMSA